MGVLFYEYYCPGERTYWSSSNLWKWVLGKFANIGGHICWLHCHRCWGANDARTCCTRMLFIGSQVCSTCAFGWNSLSGCKHSYDQVSHKLHADLQFFCTACKKGQYGLVRRCCTLCWAKLGALEGEMMQECYFCKQNRRSCFHPLLYQSSINSISEVL